MFNLFDLMRLLLLSLQLLTIQRPIHASDRSAFPTIFRQELLWMAFGPSPEILLCSKNCFQKLLQKTAKPYSFWKIHTIFLKLHKHHFYPKPTQQNHS